MEVFIFWIYKVKIKDKLWQDIDKVNYGVYKLWINENTKINYKNE